VALLAALACAQPSPFLLPGPVEPRACETAAEVGYSVFLVGDAGAPVLPPHPEAELPVDPLLRNLRDDVMEQAGMLGVARVAVLYLGDNVYPEGLPPVSLAGRKRGERILRQQIVAAGPAEAVFLAGEADWGGVGSAGWHSVRAQQGFLSTAGERISMRPPGGCSGPEPLDLGEHLRFLFLDPIALGHALDEPETHAEVCRYASAEAALVALDEEVERAPARHLVLATHAPPKPPAPARGAGSEDGRSARALYAASAGAIQRALRARRPLLIASGHEHGLQLHRDAVGAYTLVSGAGSASRVAPPAPAESALFLDEGPGYARLDVHVDGALTLAMVVIRGERREVALRHCLAERPPAGPGRKRRP
jgi:hypothetical protein